VAVRQAFRQLRPDVVVCCNQLALRVAALAGWLTRPAPPLVFRFSLEGSFRSNAHNRLVVHPRVARYVANASAGRQELLDFGWIRGDQAEVIYNGVDLSPIGKADPTGLREQLGAAPGDTVVLVAARLVQDKGHALLLQALEDGLGRRAGLHFWFAGTGPEEDRLRAIAVEKRLSGVRFLGFRTDVPRLLRAADLLCHPSRREGAPNIVLEAMGAGLPVVAVAAAGTAELVVDGATGLLSPIGDPDRLRRNLLLALSDAPLRQHLGEAGRARVLAEFTEERSLERWLALLQQVVRERTGC
jgi:glycosyltransferase involved in cell wall biosynthesis